ncbi:uncharacterized protein LOC116935800 [Daphnia magna]|uniref:uncharacterized protein LOC116935800 n=1 Tax=Daphnia magna TaxID=35525 RepID=UPI001E1BB755|nr:uncharacterized protein LOC116935800 [Daphnia magna]
MRAALMQALEKLSIYKQDPSSFRRFAEKTRTFLYDLSRIGESATADVIERLCLKLPFADRLAWNTDRGGDLERRSLNEFGNWLCQRAMAYQNAYTIAAEQPQESQPRPKERFSIRSHAANADSNRNLSGGKAATPFYCFKCEGRHPIETCAQFKELTSKERLLFCMRHKLCLYCFGTNHTSRECKIKKHCNVTGCKHWHHVLLHDENVKPESGSNLATARCNATQIKTAVGMVQAQVYDVDGNIVLANVFLDEGNDSTLFREGFIRKLRLDGTPHTLPVDGAGGMRSKYASRRVQVRLRFFDGEEETLKGSTLPTVASPAPVLEWSALKQRWKHLQDLPLQPSGRRVDILLGSDQAYFTTTLESRIGKKFEPTAILTRLGWIVRGVLGSGLLEAVVKSHAIFAADEDVDVLVQQMKRFCDSEEFGTEHQIPGMSESEKQAVQILEAGTRRLDVGYEVPITWKTGEPNLSNNRSLAEKRMKSLLRRFYEDPIFEEDYRQAMENNFKMGYAVYVEDPSDSQPEYYLAHHGVKKGKKWRVVFDAAAKFNGRCLNDSIHSSPALQNSLTSVIIKFREGEIALASDVEAMFSRIRLRTEDSRFFRFLWNRRGETESRVCEMRRLPFGATCSPFIAIATTRRAAADFAGPSFVSKAIEHKMYVDDYLSSAKTIHLAIQEATGVQEALAAGDLHLQGWISNSVEFLNLLSVDVKASLVEERSLDGDHEEKALGVYWNPTTDVVTFKGMAAPMTLKAKVKLRELQIQGLQWTDEVTGEAEQWWKKWFETLKQLNDLEIPRCLFEREDFIVRTELHSFGDASEEAYAAVVYLRNVYVDGTVLVRHVRASTKLAPKKTISIPKLELNAALLAARLVRTVQMAFTRTIHARYLWTDSSTVRNWIRATASKYQVYVSHRIGEIQMLTEVQEWRFLPGRINPADVATRSTLGEEIFPSYWWCGVEFLQHPEDRWPADRTWMVEVEEIRPVRTNVVQCESSSLDWEKMKITVEEIPALVKLQDPFNELVRRCQEEVYSAELSCLQEGKWIPSTSSLLTLSPILGREGLIRLGGRAGRAQLPYEEIHPPVLPAGHKFTVNVVRAFHLMLKHVGTDYQISFIRQHFWIPRGREFVKKVRRECTVCRRERAKPDEHLMTELHRSRLEAGTPPFTRTACDLFGPLDVGLSRNRTAKRWGVLFKGLVTRAVYLELVTSLSSDDFLLILRRFIGLYGQPGVFHTDNGTNFVGAERELREAAEALFADPKLADFIWSKPMEWKFQPPRTPDFGSANESLVKSTKRALYRALDAEKLKLQYPSEETLRTLLYEVAGLLNGRPLTAASNDPAGFRPLTPTNFLNRVNTACPPVGHFEDALPRERYRYLQRVLNLFWDIWKKVYLQYLVSRSKWKNPKPNFAVGDAVLENDSSLRRSQ